MKHAIGFNVPAAVTAPPAWFVTDGATVVGPVHTNLLLRGISHGRVADNCLVREARWPNWRRLSEVREVRALWRGQVDGGLGWHPNDTWRAPDPAREAFRNAESLLSCAVDRAEVLTLMLHAAVEETQANAGLVHTISERGIQTIAGRGPYAARHLGLYLLRSDASIEGATTGRTSIGAPTDDLSRRAAAFRVRIAGAPLRGIAVVPLFEGGQLHAVIELARCEYPFRREDGARLRAVVRAARIRRALFR